MKPIKIDATAPYLCFDFSCADEIGLQVAYQRTEHSEVEVYEFGDTDTQGTQIYRRSGKFGDPHRYMRVPLDGSDAVENIILGTKRVEIRHHQLGCRWRGYGRFTRGCSRAYPPPRSRK